MVMDYGQNLTRCQVPRRKLRGGIKMASMFGLLRTTCRQNMRDPWPWWLDCTRRHGDMMPIVPLVETALKMEVVEMRDVFVLVISNMISYDPDVRRQGCLPS